jgi:hydroxypyruvate isomerase
VNLLSGCAPADQSVNVCRSVLIENARYATDLFAPHGAQILLEAINTHDLPGYFLSHVSAAVSIIEQVDHMNINLQFDLYHAYRMGNDLYQTLSKYKDYIAHMQISGFPGRYEPDVREIDYLPLFDAIDALGYAGWVGCE